MTWSSAQNLPLSQKTARAASLAALLLLAACASPYPDAPAVPVVVAPPPLPPETVFLPTPPADTLPPPGGRVRMTKADRIGATWQPLAGTVVPAQLVTAASSDHGGAVVARVARDVLGANGCLGIQAGSTLVGAMGRTRDFGQERGEVVFEALHTPDGREVDLASAAAGDALGMGGVPGEVDLHTGVKALRVAIATAVDLGSAYLGGRAIDEWARQALERKPSITLDPLKQPITLTVILTRPITL